LSDILHANSEIRLPMNILAFTTLFPNDRMPTLGIFIWERMRHVAKHEALRVVAPVPWSPRVPLPARWSRFRGVSRVETRDGIVVHHPRYPVTPKVGMRYYGRWMATATKNLVDRLHREKPIDVIDAHYVYPDGEAAMLHAQRLGVPFVVSARGTDINLYPDIPAVRPRIVEVLRRADRVIAVSAALADKMIALGAEANRVVTIPNGVDTAVFAPMEKVEARQLTHLPQQVPIVVTTANLVPLKGIDLLIEAIASVTGADGAPAHLVVVGDGEEKDRLVAQASRLGISDRVHFVGMVSHTQLRPWFCAGDLTALASSREGWPNVLMESIACGRGVVATRVGGTPEILTSEDLGILVDERSAPALAEALNRGLRHRFDLAAMHRFTAASSWDRVADRVIGVLESVVR
jgi:glycosyltransferase involved in cell wall biosynthesis